MYVTLYVDAYVTLYVDVYYKYTVTECIPSVVICQ